MNKILFTIGWLIVGIAVVLLLMDVIESGVAVAIGIVGIGLIAASGRSNIKKCVDTDLPAEKGRGKEPGRIWRASSHAASRTVRPSPWMATLVQRS